MAWTTPKTWASGYVVLAADLNTHLRDQLNVTAPAIMTTQGDIVIASGANTPIRLAKSTTSTQYLANTGTSNAPAWNEVALDTGISGVLPVANGGVGVALSAPGADRILMWDHSATAYAYLTAGANLTISGTTMTAEGGLDNVVEDTSPQLGGTLDMQAHLLAGNGGTTGIAISSVGEVTMAAQPAFLAAAAADGANVTGNYDPHTGVFDSEIFDQNADFDGTSTFTAPVTGRYRISFLTAYTQLTSSHTQMATQIVTSNRNYSFYSPNPWAVYDATNAIICMAFSMLTDMDATDTFTIVSKIGPSGAAKVIDWAGGIPYLSAELVV